MPPTPITAPTTTYHQHPTSSVSNIRMYLRSQELSYINEADIEKLRMLLFEDIIKNCRPQTLVSVVCKNHVKTMHQRRTNCLLIRNLGHCSATNPLGLTSHMISTEFQIQQINIHHPYHNICIIPYYFDQYIAHL